MPELVNGCDWMLSEGAYADVWYSLVLPYIDNDKTVFFIEYTDDLSESEFKTKVCPIAAVNQFSAVFKNRDLTTTTVYCN